VKVPRGFGWVEWLDTLVVEDTEEDVEAETEIETAEEGT